MRKKSFGFEKKISALIPIPKLISADVLLKMTTILKEMRIAQLRSKNKRTLIDSLFQGFVTVNGKAVKKADLQADNGVIHFVSEMLEPMVTKDIPAVLTSDGRFGTLLTAIEMAGLGEMLTQSTFFACNLLLELCKQSLLYLAAFVFLLKATADF